MKKYLFHFLITLFSIQISYAQCDNVTSSGSIAADQVVCADNPDPAILINLELPEGGSGDLEFIWISATQNPNSATAVWFPIPGSTESSYDPGPISQTTYYRRCSRRAGCTEYIGESNIVTVEYADECADECEFFKVTVMSVTSADCDLFNGTVNLSIVAGVLPLSYNLNGEILDELPETYAPGSYELTVTDAEGCIDNVSFLIEGAENTIAVIGDTVNPVCQSPNGSIDLSISGGTGAYSIIWNDGNTDTNRTNLLEGTYSVTVSDEAGCSVEENFVLTMSAGDLDVNLNISNASCEGNDGSAEVIIEGGVAPYSIELDGNQVSEISNLSPGSYLVSVTDVNGCSEDLEFVIEGSDSALEISGSIINPICTANNGSINLEITGNTGLVSINWDFNNSEDATLQNLAAGVYNVTATDENGCSASESFTLTPEDSDLIIDFNTTNAICAGTGSVDITVSNGTEPYAVIINNDLSIAPNALPAGIYLISVTDANGCQAETTFTIEEIGSDITIQGTTTNPMCFNDSGSISLAITGGTGIISVLWSDGNMETDRTDLAAGIYSVTATDENGCSASESFTLTPEDSDLIIDFNTTNAICAGTGSVDITVSNGTEPYAVIINNDLSIAPNALPAGIYLISVTDANGCQAETTFTIEEIGSDITIQGTTTNPMCFNDSGSISLAITGGTGIISVLWSDGNMETDRTDLAAGIYSVTATDENGCSASESFTLTPEDSDLDLSLILTDVSCNGGNDGAATTQITGGTAPYILSLDGIEVNEIANLSAGEYTAKVVDAQGCSVSVPFSIAQPPLIVVEANIQNPSCGVDNGNIELILSGGTGNYTVIWDDDLSNDLTRTNLAAGVYSLTVKDENDCVVSAQFTLIGESSSLETELSITNVSCNGASDGSVNVIINNGTPPYVFTLNGAVVLDLNNLSAGNYTLETTDITGCSISEEFTISQASEINITATTVNPTCNVANGNIALDITGGTPDVNGNYTIAWSNGDGNNLAAGDYSLTVTDANNCSQTATFTLSNEGSDLEVSVTTTAVTCVDAEDGTANINITEGTEPFSYVLNGDAIDMLPTNYAAGDYTLMITDAGGCSTNVNFSIGNQTAIELSATISNAGCSGEGAINLAVVGGTEPYQFLWSNDSNTQNLNDIPSGNYFVTVTDANGCAAVNEVAYTVEMDNGEAFSISVSTTDVSCFGGMDGTATVSFIGGVEPFSYVLNGMNLSNLPTTFVAGDYNLTVQDANGCAAETTFTISQAETEISFSGLVQSISCESELGNITLSVAGGIAPYDFLWSNNEVSQNLNDVSIGSYTVTITDANGCSVNNDDTPYTFVGNANLALNSTFTPTSCGENNGEISITVSQGVPPYQIVWSDGLTDFVLRTDLASGDYGVTVTDANNCSISEAFSIASSINLTVNITPLDASCNGIDDGQISMSFAGGTPPFTYILNGQSLDDLPNTLPSGNYQLQVFDALGCSDLVEFSIGEPDEIIYLAELTDATCPDDFVTVEFTAVQGGSGTYSYLWSDGSTSLNRDNLTDGTYFLTITDTNGCTAISEPFVANVPDEILITADEGDFQNVSCMGESDGAVNITVTGGTPPYSYFWSNGETTEDIDNLAPDEYLLNLSDAEGCISVFLAVISNPDELTASTIVTDASCLMEDGSASIWPQGGTHPYFFLWENGATGAEEFNLAPGVYQVTVSDLGSCEIVIDFEVGEMDCLQSETGDDFNFVMNELTPDLANNSVELHWMTEAEASESFFIIQHSLDGISFTDVTGLLPGEGATQVQNEYYNTCPDMALGTHFFRIRYIDSFGNLRNSEIMSTELIPDNPMEFSVFPNPTEDNFRISFLVALDSPATVRIVNAQSVILENITAPAGTLHQSVDLRKYNPGVYFVVIEHQGLRRLTKRIVKM